MFNKVVNRFVVGNSSYADSAVTTLGNRNNPILLRLNICGLNQINGLRLWCLAEGAANCDCCAGDAADCFCLNVASWQEHRQRWIARHLYGQVRVTVDRDNSCCRRTDPAAATCASTQRISNVNDNAWRDHNASINGNSKTDCLRKQPFAGQQPLAQPVRLALAVTTNRLYVFVNDAVLGDSIMVFNVFVFNLAQCVVALPCDRRAGVSGFLCCAAVSEKALNNVAWTEEILRVRRFVLPDNK